MLVQTLVLLSLASVTYARPPTKQSIPMPVTANTDWSTTLDVAGVSGTVNYEASDRSRGVTEFVKTLQAIYYWSCPTGGRGSKEFVWRAVFRLRDAKLFMFNQQNVGRFYEQAKGPNTFSARWNGYDCIHVGSQYCSYVIYGKTEGTIFSEGMTMSLITGGNTPMDNPMVTEMCFDNVPAGTCPAIPPGRAASICAVNRVDVTVLQ